MTYESMTPDEARAQAGGEGTRRGECFHNKWSPTSPQCSETRVRRLRYRTMNLTDSWTWCEHHAREMEREHEATAGASPPTLPAERGK